MLIVNLKNGDETLDCERFEEMQHGLVLYRSEDDLDAEDQTIVGYVPYEELHYIEVETQADDRVLP